MISYTSNAPPTIRRPEPDGRAWKRLTVPADVTDPFALEVFDVLRFSGQSPTALEHGAGLGQHTICKWFQNFNPTLRALQALLQHLGYRLVLEPIDDDEDDERHKPEPPQFASGRTYG